MGNGKIVNDDAVALLVMMVSCVGGQNTQDERLIVMMCKQDRKIGSLAIPRHCSEKH